MNTTTSGRLSRPERRDEVRRLYFRSQLPMQRIAEKLGVTRYTVWRDVRWWQQRMPDLANPDSRHSLIEIVREMDDLKAGAWRAFLRSQPPEQVETETSLSPEPEVTRPARSADPKSTGNAQCINAITRLLAQQAKLVVLLEDRAAKQEEEKAGANVVLYLPDNGRDRKECGIRNAECGMAEREREASGNGGAISRGNSVDETAARAAGGWGPARANANGDERSRRSNEAGAGVGRLDGGCLARSASPVASNRGAHSLARMEEGRCEFASANVQGENSAANPAASNRVPLDDPLLAPVQQAATNLQHESPGCNAAAAAQDTESEAHATDNPAAPTVGSEVRVAPVPATSVATQSRPYRERPFRPTTNEGFLRLLGGERLSLFDP